jgi:hypothetical protein
MGYQPHWSGGVLAVPSLAKERSRLTVANRQQAS